MVAYNEIGEPGTPEWDEAKKKAVLARQFDEEVAQADAERKGSSVSSWARIDLHDTIYGELPEITPAVLHRDDGEHLGYRGCTHSIHGPAGSGKTWLALLAVAQRLKDGDHALYLDYESFPLQIVKRLMVLGVASDAIDTRLHYHRPQSAPDTLEIDRNTFSHLVAQHYAVAVIDGANISMALCGLNPDSAVDVAQWHARIMLPISEKTGAATFANDHVPKNNSLPSGFAIGSQHEVAGLTGAAFVVEKMVPFGRGRHGVATVRVSHEKDREGYVHGVGTDDGQPDGLLVAELHVNAEIAPTTVSLCAPTTEIIGQVAEKRAKRRGGSGGPTADITYEMEVVSAYWQQMKADPQQRTQNKTVEALLARQSSGTTYERTLTNRALRLAVKALADPATQDGPYAKEDDTITLRGGRHPYSSVKPYTRAASNGVVIRMPGLSSKQQKG